MPANAIGASGILATVTAGIYMGIRAPEVLPSRARLEGYFVWDILDFIINAILFVLIGLQLRAVVDGLTGYSASKHAAIAFSLAVVFVCKLALVGLWYTGGLSAALALAADGSAGRPAPGKASEAPGPTSGGTLGAG